MSGEWYLSEKGLIEQFNDLKSEYQVANNSRFRRNRGVSSTGKTADYMFIDESKFFRGMEYVRDMDVNDSLISQIVKRAVDNTIRDGFPLRPQTGDPEVDQYLKNKWIEHTTDPERVDASGELDFLEMLKLSFRQMLIDGDIIAIPTTEGSLQLIEAHRVKTPSNTKRNVVLGVLLDERRRRLEYWVTKDEISPSYQIQRVGDVEAFKVRDDRGLRQVFHLYNPKRVSQTRGLSAFACVADIAGMFEDINFAKLVQQQAASCFAILHEQGDISRKLTGLPGTESDLRSTQTMKNGGTRVLKSVAPGMEIFGRPGEKISGFSPNIPNPEYFSHVKLLITLIGNAIGMPLILVLLDASQTNFSGYRGVVDQARIGFKSNQGSITGKICRPYYKWLLNFWLEQDSPGFDPKIAAYYLKLQDKLFNHTWGRPQYPYIQPLQDAKADQARLDGGMISPSQLQQERYGREWEEFIKIRTQDRLQEIQKAMQAVQDLKKEFPDINVDWREIITGKYQAKGGSDVKQPVESTETAKE